MSGTSKKFLLLSNGLEVATEKGEEKNANIAFEMFW